MPYKDPQKKMEWEQRHRPRRLARRRELRRIEAAKEETHLEVSEAEGSGALLFPLVAGGALAAYNPKLAIGAGAVTLIVAVAYKKDWRWWIVGILLLAFGLFFQWNKKNTNE